MLHGTIFSWIVKTDLVLVLFFSDGPVVDQEQLLDAAIAVQEKQNRTGNPAEQWVSDGIDHNQESLWICERPPN